MSSAVDIVHHFKPVNELDQAIYTMVRRLKQRQPMPFPLKGLQVQDNLVEGRYEVRENPAEELGETASLGALATTGALFLRALVTRRAAHWAGALGAGAVVLMTAPDLVRKARAAVDRWTGRGGLAVLKVQPEDVVLTYGDQEIHMTIPPMKGVVLRTFRHQLTGRSEQHYALHIELQDGRIISLAEWEEALAARRTTHQVARALHLAMAFQNVDVTEVDQGYSWELGPQLVEPAMN